MSRVGDTAPMVDDQAFGSEVAIQADSRMMVVARAVVLVFANCCYYPGVAMVAYYLVYLADSLTMDILFGEEPMVDLVLM